MSLYTTQHYRTTTTVSDYLEHYVDVETFLNCCRKCPNYEKIWSCPPYDFDVLEYWKKYQYLDLIATKIIFDESYAGQAFSREEMEEIMEKSLYHEKNELSLKLFEREKEVPGSVSLSAGSCTLCRGNCTRTEKKPCRYPDQMRYSIESLGGNVGLTIQRLMGIELEWMEEGKLPHYFVLVSGLLHN